MIYIGINYVIVNYNVFLADNLDIKCKNVQFMKTQGQVKLHLNPGDLEYIKPVKTHDCLRISVNINHTKNKYIFYDKAEGHCIFIFNTIRRLDSLECQRPILFDMLC